MGGRAIADFQAKLASAVMMPCNQLSVEFTLSSETLISHSNRGLLTDRKAE